jgi:DNA repair exonuclease SbcCD ATPase subunit
VSFSHPQEADASLMTLRQAAERTGLSATTLRRYIKAGKLKARLIPGRYGPEYVVDEEALEEARLDGQTNIPPREAPRETETRASDSPARRNPSSPPEPGGDSVPGLLYRELLMKHEHLLVQYGMLRVSGQQLYEIRQEAEQKAEEARRTATELRRQRERHAREIGELKTKLRRAELEIAERETRVRELEQRLTRAEMELRNASTAKAMDAEFARVVPSAPGSPRDH